MSEAKEIFFHVGLGKTGTTYLQHRFFPQLENIEYIQRTNYRNNKYVDHIEQSPNNRFLVSNEFDRQLEQELHNIADKYPQAKIIIVLRRQDSWIASQFRRMVKNGYPGSFNDFIDVDKDQGDWKQRELFFFPKLQLIEQLFQHKPLVMFHQDLMDDPFHFFDRLASYMNATYTKEAVNLNVKHSSYSEKQLRFIHKANPGIPGKTETRLARNYWLRKVQTRMIMLPRYLLMSAAELAPESWLPEEALIDKSSLEKVRDFYADDWEQCIQYASENNPV